MVDSDHFPSVFLSFWFAAIVQSSASPQRGDSPPVPGTRDKWCLLPPSLASPPHAPSSMVFFFKLPAPRFSLLPTESHPKAGTKMHSHPQPGSEWFVGYPAPCLDGHLSRKLTATGLSPKSGSLYFHCLACPSSNSGKFSRVVHNTLKMTFFLLTTFCEVPFRRTLKHCVVFHP